MIYSAKVRSDVFLITQNALADNTYMNVMRDLYGDQIWIPTPQDTNRAFQSYVEDVRAGRIPQNAAVTVDKSGKVSVQGVQGVMEINGIISKAIFEMNKAKHAFYVEESYVIAWMYPYLEPHGLIMKINKEPLPSLTTEMVKNDTEFWNWYANRLLNNRKFQRDSVARKSFSKLRCAIAGLYAYRRMFNEAEAAFRQAVNLYPGSPEANFRLADLYLQSGRFADAKEIMKKNLEQDPRNDKIVGFINQIEEMERTNSRINELQSQLATGKGSLDMVFELCTLFLRSNKDQPFTELAIQVLNNTNLPPQVYLKIAEIAMSVQPPRLPMMAEAYQRYLMRERSDPKVWYELGCVMAALGQPSNALHALQQAVNIGGEPIRDGMRKDPRLEPMRGVEAFQKLMAPSPQGFSPFPGLIAP
jgi:tetratricopeptide (TPR) repeat protein